MHFMGWVHWWHNHHNEFQCKVTRLGTYDGYKREVIVVTFGVMSLMSWIENHARSRNGKAQRYFPKHVQRFDETNSLVAVW